MSFSRQTIYAGELLQIETDLQQMRDDSKSLAQFIADAMGVSTYYTGLAATPGTGLEVEIGIGCIYQYGEIDPTAWSTLQPDTWEGTLLGLVLSEQTLSGFAPPVTVGQSINYLIEAQVQVQDTAAVNLPFTNGATPPVTVYQSLSPSRQNVVVFQVKAGTAATTGTQTTPTTDSGWIPLYDVTVDYGESSLTQADIVQASNAPLFSGFVHTNPNGNTPVYLNPASQQTGNISISGVAILGSSGSTNVSWISIGNDTGMSGSTGYTTLATGSGATNGVGVNGVDGDILGIGDYGTPWKFALDKNGNGAFYGGLTIGGSIDGSAGHAGTDADPFPLSPLNVEMLGGKVASDYALASGHYITLYSGTPTADPTNVNAAIGGYFVINAPQGTAPITVVSTTQCPNLNAQFVGGYTPGNAEGDIPVSNGTLCTNLNAELLNGLASSAFQPAGSYAVMNADNAGDFTASGSLLSTGGTGSTQVQLNYVATNAAGLNNGGPISYIYSATAPFGINASSLRTTGPVYVGDSTRQNIYMQDVVPSGVLRSGTCIYTVTYGGTSNSHPYPGNGTAWGTYGSNAGQIEIATDGVLNQTFYIGYRTKITLSGTLSVKFQGLGKCTGTVYVDNSVVGTVGGQMGGFNYTFSAGTHTVDIVYTSTSMGAEYYEGSYGTGHDQGGSLTVYGWLPMSSGQLSSAITALAPG